MKIGRQARDQLAELIAGASASPRRFRLNRRRSKSRGKLFFRLVQQAVAVEPVPLDRILHPEAKPKTKHNL